jgi:hypothetical protein
MHLARVRRTGDPDSSRPAQLKRSDSHWVAKDRVRRTRGRADSYRCADCAAPALVWSYDGTDPAERVCPARGYLYSHDPNRYRARCQSCHRRATTILHSLRRRNAGPRYLPVQPTVPAASVRAAPPDHVPGRNSVEQRAVWLYERGVSLRGVGEELAISPSTAARLLRSLGIPIRPVGRRRRYIGSAP